MIGSELVRVAALSLAMALALGEPCRAYADREPVDSVAKAPKKKTRTDRARTEGGGSHKKTSSASTVSPTKPEAIDAPLLELRDPVTATDTTSSGLSLAIVERPTASSTFVVLRLPFGSSVDPADQGGLVAVLAHASVSRDVKERGAFAGAGGTETVTVDSDAVTYSLSVPGDDPSSAFDLVAAQMQTPVDDASIAAARAELRTDLVGDARALLTSLAFEGDAPYAHRSSGSPVYLARVNPASVEEFRAAHYQVNGARMAIVVPEHADTLLKAAKTKFDGAARSPIPAPLESLPEQTNQRASDIEEAGAPTMLFEAWPLRGADARDLDRLEVESSLLGDGGGVADALAKVGIDGRATSTVDRRSGPSIFELEITLANDTDVAKAKHAIDDCLADAAKHAPSAEDLSRAKREVSVARAAELDDPARLALRLAAGEGSAQGAQANLAAISADELPKVVGRLLGPLTRSIVETRDPSRAKTPRSGGPAIAPAHTGPTKRGAEPKHSSKAKKRS